ITGKGAKILVDRYSTSIAHELLHCSNVSHHGRTDLWFVRWERSGNNLIETPLDDNYNPAGSSKTIRLQDVKWEPSPPEHPQAEPVSAEQLTQWLTGLPGGAPTGAILFVAAQKGQHSGYRDCVMRYDVPAAFVPAAGDQFRYLNRKRGKDFELPGTSLCDQKEDSGVPELDLPPLHRYGDATFGLCKSQICVNDARHQKP